MYQYETHLHTAPVSKCGKVGVRENLEFYKQLGYAGVFITNHFIDGNISIDHSAPYEERIRYFFSDYEAALSIGRELGIAVFSGVEVSYKGTDFLVYGLDKAWFLAHPEYEALTCRQKLELMMANGALVIQAHPYREAGYIDHIRLFPRSVHGIEIYNATQSDLRNHMATHYAEMYELLPFAGSDNHRGSLQSKLGGMESDTPIENETDFVRRVLAGKMRVFSRENPLAENAENV